MKTIGRLLCVCALLAGYLRAQEPANFDLLRTPQKIPEAFKLTYLQKEHKSGYAAKIVQYRDGNTFHYERYLMSDKGDPVFDAAFEYDGIVYKHLYLGRMWVSKDPNKTANGLKLFWPNNPIHQYYLPFLRLEENCNKLMEPKALESAASQIRLMPKAADIYAYADENAELTVNIGKNGVMRRASGKIDGFDVDYDFAGVFPFGGVAVPRITTVRRKAIPEGWREWTAIGEVHETFELVENECEIKQRGFIQKEKIEIPVKLVKHIIDVDLGLDTTIRR